jgi:hypothetical protein
MKPETFLPRPIARLSPRHDRAIGSAVLGACAMLLSLPGGVAPAAHAQSYRSSAEAPKAWNDYAFDLRRRCEAMLQSDDAAASRLRAAVAKYDPGTGLLVSVWVAPSGQVQNAVFAGLPDADASTELKALLTRIVAGSPPSDLLQPIRLRLKVDKSK